MNLLISVLFLTCITYCVHLSPVRPTRFLKPTVLLKTLYPNSFEGHARCMWREANQLPPGSSAGGVASVTECVQGWDVLPPPAASQNRLSKTCLEYLITKQPTYSKAGWGKKSSFHAFCISHATPGGSHHQGNFGNPGLGDDSRVLLRNVKTGPWGSQG